MPTWPPKAITSPQGLSQSPEGSQVSDQLAIDIVLADGKLTQSEREFIGRITEWLTIDKSIEWQISRVMLIKNNC